MSCLGEFAVPLRASNAFNGAGRGGRLGGGDISRGRLGNAAGGSLPELQFLHKLLVLPRPFDSRVAPHGPRVRPSTIDQLAQPRRATANLAQPSARGAIFTA